MRSTKYALLLLLSCCVSAGAQTGDEGTAALRDNLSVGSDVNVRTSQSPLPGHSPLKVFVATGPDLGVHRNFEKWLKEWNKKDRKKFGELELVSQLAQADVILSRYVDQNKVIYQTNTSWFGKFPTTNSYAPVFACIVLQNANGLEIVSQYVEQGLAEGHKRSGQKLRDDFFKMLKSPSRLQRR